MKFPHLVLLALLSVDLLPIICLGKQNDTLFWLPRQYVSHIDSFSKSRIHLIECINTVHNDIYIDNRSDERFGKAKLTPQKTSGLYKLENLNLFLKFPKYTDHKQEINNCYLYTTQKSISCILRYTNDFIDTIEYINSFQGYTFEGFVPTSIRLHLKGKYSVLNSKKETIDAVTINLDGTIISKNAWEKYNVSELNQYYIGKKVYYSNGSDFKIDIFDTNGKKESFIAIRSLANRKDYALWTFDASFKLKNCVYKFRRLP